MTAFWYVITGLGIVAAIINFAIAVSRREKRMVALVRALAGVVALIPPVGIIVGKLVLNAHPPFVLEWQTVFIATGVFVFAVLLLPTYVDKGDKEHPRISMQQRAARPANATIRLQKGGGDEWVN